MGSRVEKGFTLIETVVVIVIISIFVTAAQARLSIFDLFQNAEKTEATLNMESIRYSHGFYMNTNVFTNLSGQFPTLLMLSGYAAAVPGTPGSPAIPANPGSPGSPGSPAVPASPGAPAGQPMLFDFAWWQQYFNGQQLTIPLSNANLPCDTSLFGGITPNSPYVFTAQSVVGTVGTAQGISGTSPEPRCAMTYSLFDPTMSYSLNNKQVWHSTGDLANMEPNRVRKTCHPYSAQYGVQYLITNTTGADGGNGSEIGSWWGNGGAVGYSSVLIWWQHFTSGTAPGTCEPVGGAKPATPYIPAVDPVAAVPATPYVPAVPATPGTPEVPPTFPLAVDGGGLCVADGWEIKTYKDADGTQPTTSTADPVGFVAAQPIQDAVQCPKGPLPKTPS